jgi:DNA-binding PadR family transcriptional regulator
MAREDPDSYLPLTETTTYIMLALAEPLHGYAVMQRCTELSKGTVRVGAGTLYNALSKLEKEALIVKVRQDDRRKYYCLTDKGRLVLERQVARMARMVRSARRVQAALTDAEAGQPAEEG